MGEKPLSILIKYSEKIETFTLILASFTLFFIFGKPALKHETHKIHSEEALTAGVYFDGTIRDIQYKMIENSRTSIKAATYTYAAGIFSELLEKKSSEGVKVRVVAGNNKDNSDPGFDFAVFHTKYGIYHPKFMVSDSKNVLISSSNFTSDDKSSNSAVLFIDVPKAAKILENDIDSVFSGRLDNSCAKGCETEIGTIFFNPGKACMAVKQELLRSEKSIKTAMYTITLKNPMVTALKNRIRAGINTDLIFDNWKGSDSTIVNGRAFKYFSSIGTDVQYDESQERNDTLFHHKFAVIDETVTVFGSMNWTSSGCYRNREIIVINKNQKIAEKFKEFFDNYKIDR